MNWGGFAALSLDPRSRGMNLRSRGMAGLMGLAGKPWKKLGISKSEFKAQKTEIKRGLKTQYEGTGTKAEMKEYISSLREQKAAATTKEEKARLKLRIRGAEAAKRSLTAAGSWYKPSPTQGVPEPAYDLGPGPNEPPPDTGPTPSPGDVWNTDGNGVPAPAGPTNGTPTPSNGGPIYALPAPVSPGGTSITVGVPGTTPVSAGPSTGMTMWDTISQVTGGNKTLLIGGAALLAYFLFFRKKR